MINNANHVYQLMKDNFVKKSEITQEYMHSHIDILRERNEMKSLDERKKQVVVKRYDNLAHMIK
jgi:hypothetical protein